MDTKGGKGVSERQPCKKTVCSSCVQSWLVAIGGWWQLDTGGWWRLGVVAGGWWLVIGGWWRLAVGGWWRLAGGNWRLAVGGGWGWLAVGGWVGGGWRLAVGAPLGRVLKGGPYQKKNLVPKGPPLNSAVAPDDRADLLVTGYTVPLIRVRSYGRALPHRPHGVPQTGLAIPHPRGKGGVQLGVRRARAGGGGGLARGHGVGLLASRPCTFGASVRRARAGGVGTRPWRWFACLSPLHIRSLCASRARGGGVGTRPWRWFACLSPLHIPSVCASRARGGGGWHEAMALVCLPLDLAHSERLCVARAGEGGVRDFPPPKKVAQVTGPPETLP